MALAGYLVICFALWSDQDKLLYYPRPMAPGGEAFVQPLRAQAPRVLVSTRELDGPDAIVYFGGNAEDVSRNLPEFSAAFPKHALYLLHYRGYGGSEGKPAEADLYADALALFDKAHARHARVVVVGRSLGSGLAVRVASVRPASRLVLVTPYDSIVGVAQQHYPWMPVSVLMHERYESFLYAPKVRAPTRLIVAGDDETIPRWSSERLYSRFAPGVAKMTVLARTGHNSISDHHRYLGLFVAP